MGNKPVTEEDIEKMKQKRFLTIKELVYVKDCYYSTVSRWPQLDENLEEREVYVKSDGGIVPNGTEMLIDTEKEQVKYFINRGKKD